MPNFTCRGCGHEEPFRWPGPCPRCHGLWSAVEPRTVDIDEHVGFTTLGGKGRLSGPQFISTGQPGFDHVMGGGIRAGRVVLLGGYAGVGKMRMLLPIADYIAKTQGVVLYASGEESTTDVNEAAVSLGLVNDRVVVLGNQSCVEDVLENADKLRAFLIIWDSAQEFVSIESGGSAGSPAQCKTTGKVIRTYCGKKKVCSIIVNQMTGDDRLKGGTELEHSCDTVNLLAYPKEDDENAPGYEDEGYRILVNLNKNRGAVANLCSYWRMTNTGVLEHVPARSKLVLPGDDDGDDDEPPKRKKKLYAIV